MIRQRDRSAGLREHHAPDLARSPASAPTWTGLYRPANFAPVIQPTLDTGSGTRGRCSPGSPDIESERAGASAHPAAGCSAAVGAADPRPIDRTAGILMSRTGGTRKRLRAKETAPNRCRLERRKPGHLPYGWQAGRSVRDTPRHSAMTLCGRAAEGLRASADNCSGRAR